MWHRFLVEMRKFAIVASFLFFFFGAFATYRRLILSEYQIDYFQYGYAPIQALVLGKVVLIGEIFHLGERFHGKPLIFPTLYKNIFIQLLVLVFAVHGTLRLYSRGTYRRYRWNLAAKDGADILAKILAMFIAFIPMFTISEIANLFGEGKLFELFFERGGTAGTHLPYMSRAAWLREG